MKYVYNINCADYLMRHGANCLGTGFSRDKNRTWWAFDYEQCQMAYKMWNKHKKVREIIKEGDKKNETHNDSRNNNK